MSNFTSETITVGTEEIKVYRVDSNASGAPRYVIHYLAIPFRVQFEDESFYQYQAAERAHARAAVKGKDYKARWFGGGVVFVSYDIEADLAAALEYRSTF